MPKSSPSDQHTFSYMQPLQRRPLRSKLEKNSEYYDDDEEEEEEMDMNLYKNSYNLYPDLREELKTVKPQNKSPDTEKKKSNKPSQSIQLDNTAQAKSSSSYFNCILYILVSILAIVGIGYNFIFPASSNPKETTAKLDVTELIADMQKQFNGQHSQTFRLLKFDLTKVVDEQRDPSRPAVITVMANRGAENTASDFTTYLANALTRGKYLTINESASDKWSSNPDTLKYKIDYEIKSKLESRNLNVVIIDRLHNIPIDAAMIFHSYCDHEFAPYKRAVYLFIVHLDVVIPENSDIKLIDTIAMDRLRNIWQKASDDVVDSLITRITANVINIR